MNDQSASIELAQRTVLRAKQAVAWVLLGLGVAVGLLLATAYRIDNIIGVIWIIAATTAPFGIGAALALRLLHRRRFRTLVMLGAGCALPAVAMDLWGLSQLRHSTDAQTGIAALVAVPIYAQLASALGLLVGAAVARCPWPPLMLPAERRLVVCRRCGYSLAGLKRDVCPECGERFVTEP